MMIYFMTKNTLRRFLKNWKEYISMFVQLGLFKALQKGLFMALQKNLPRIRLAISFKNIGLQNYAPFSKFAKTNHQVIYTA